MSKGDIYLRDVVIIKVGFEVIARHVASFTVAR